MDKPQDENEELVILRSAVENTNEAFVTIDENHRVWFFNKAAETIFGHDRNDVIGRDLGVIMSPDCSKDHRFAVERYLKTRTPTRIGHETEMVATRKDGSKFPAAISFSVSEVEQSTYFTGIVRDLTETKQLQEQIIQSERLAAIGHLVAEISHEIKNPLMMIGGFANQLIRQTSDSKAIDKLTIIANEVSRLEKLLSELRAYYQPGAFRTEKINISDLMRHVVDLVQDECEKKNIYIEYTEVPSLFLNGDKDKLKQVYVNLIKNAIEAMKDGGSLSIQVREIGGTIETTISDTGQGVAECDKEKIFTPFFTTKKRGTGLGLGISKAIVEAHDGGELGFESLEGKGTTFRVRIPVSGKRSMQ